MHVLVEISIYVACYSHQVSARMCFYCVDTDRYMCMWLLIILSHPRTHACTHTHTHTHTHTLPDTLTCWPLFKLTSRESASHLLPNNIISTSAGANYDKEKEKEEEEDEEKEEKKLLSTFHRNHKNPVINKQTKTKYLNNRTCYNKIICTSRSFVQLNQ